MVDDESFDVEGLIEPTNVPVMWLVDAVPAKVTVDAPVVMTKVTDPLEAVPVSVPLTRQVELLLSLKLATPLITSPEVNTMLSERVERE